MKQWSAINKWDKQVAAPKCNAPQNIQRTLDQTSKQKGTPNLFPQRKHTQHQSLDNYIIHTKWYTIRLLDYNYSIFIPSYYSLSIIIPS